MIKFPLSPLLNTYDINYSPYLYLASSSRPLVIKNLLATLFIFLFVFVIFVAIETLLRIV